MLADIFKSAIAAVAVKNIGGLREFGRRTIRLPFLAADLAGLCIPQHVAGPEKIQGAIVVGGEEAGRTGPTSGRYTGFGGDVGKGAIAVVVIQHVFSVAGDVKIRKAVVIVVADRDADSVIAVAGAGEAGFLGHVSEAAIRILAVETVPVLRVLAIEFFGLMHRVGEVTAIHQENVEQAVVVVIE